MLVLKIKSQGKIQNLEANKQDKRSLAGKINKFGGRKERERELVCLFVQGILQREIEYLLLNFKKVIKFYLPTAPNGIIPKIYGQSFILNKAIN